MKSLVNKQELHLVENQHHPVLSHAELIPASRHWGKILMSSPWFISWNKQAKSWAGIWCNYQIIKKGITFVCRPSHNTVTLGGLQFFINVCTILNKWYYFILQICNIQNIWNIIKVIQISDSLTQSCIFWWIVQTEHLIESQNISLSSRENYI